MLTLQPQNYFTIVRQIPNWTDSSTNYVQAVIRNAFTDTIIATLNLTDKTGQRFKVDWQVPADPSGQGFYISIITSVYTDVGYTSKNPNYGDDENTYLVQERVRLNGLGGSGMDAFDVRRILKEELALIKPEKEEPEVKEPMQWDNVLSALANIRVLMTQNEANKPDYGPILEKLESISTAINDKEVTPPVDITPLLTRINENKDADMATAADLKEKIEMLLEAVAKIIPEKFAQILSEVLDKKQFATSLVTHVITTGTGVEKKKVHDISKL